MDTDLTATAGAPSYGWGMFCAYPFEKDHTQHVMYIAIDGHIHELWKRDNEDWRDANITAGAGVALPAGGILKAYSFEERNTQHLMYRSKDAHIYELWGEPGQGWQHIDDLTLATGAPGLPGWSYWTAYVFPEYGTQHLVYYDVQGAIVELWGSPGGLWRFHYLTSRPASPVFDWQNRRLAAYVYERQSTQHVIYISADDEHMHELWWDRLGWHATDLSELAGRPPILLPWGMTAYAYESQGTQHVMYASADGGIHELWWGRDGVHDVNLSSRAGAGAVAGPQQLSAITACAFEWESNYQVVAYVDYDSVLSLLIIEDSGVSFVRGGRALVAGPQAYGVQAYTYVNDRSGHLIYVSVGDRHIHDYELPP